MEFVENKVLKEVARPEGFELPTLWFEASVVKI
jgi:hypothetical protein